MLAAVQALLLDQRPNIDVPESWGRGSRERFAGSNWHHITPSEPWRHCSWRAASPRSTFAQISRGHACASTMCLTLQCSRNLLRRRRLSHPRGPRYQHVGLRPCRRHVFGKLHVPPHFPIFVYDTHKRSELSDRGLKFSRQRTLSRPISLRQKKGKAYPAGSIQKLGCRTKRCWCLHLERRDRHAWVDRMRRGEKNKTTAPWIELIRPALPGREGE
jgi:hypothetical protein